MYWKRAKQTFSAIFALLSLSITLYSIVKFINFVSMPRATIDSVIKSEWKYSIRALLNNLTWLTLFILHHSLGKHDAVKKFWEKIQLKSIERAAYNVISALILLQMVERWAVTSKWTVWSFNVKEYSPIFYVFILLHSLYWIIIIVGSLLMDVPEILGIKQVYYDVKGLHDPSTYKAIPHNRLLSSIRHPSYIGFSLLFWMTNVMSLDRLFLALFLTLYMFVAWSPDRKDYEYQQNQLQLKKLELKYDFKQS